MNSITKDLSFKISQYKKNHQTIVLVTGVFDILHIEHINFLNKAKKLADILIIAIESDVRVRKIKGEERPVNSQEIRDKQLTNLHISDHIIILPEKFSHSDDHDQFIGSIKPDVLAVSSHTKHLEKKKEIIEKHGGVLRVVYEHQPHISSSVLKKSTA